jgi:hypothetical protein
MFFPTSSLRIRDVNEEGEYLDNNNKTNANDTDILEQLRRSHTAPNSQPRERVLASLG